MKRLLVVFLVLGAIAALALSHLVLAGKDSDKMVWCHARDAVIAPESWQTDTEDNRAAEVSDSAETTQTSRADLTAGRL